MESTGTVTETLRRYPKRAAIAAVAAFLVLVALFIWLTHHMNPLPRNMSLKAFNPHRETFECRHEAEHVPAIDPEADGWNMQALALTSPTLWPDEQNYPGAIELWRKAAQRKHWKGMLNLANAYAQGLGVDRDSEMAIRITEEAMKLGIPAAFDLMGSFHLEGRGVNRDIDRAYAFWQLAADMGSPSAQAYLGDKLLGVADDPSTGTWGNRSIGIIILECSYAQGSAKGAHSLGVALKGDMQYARALVVLHDGVKFGSSDCAGSLGTAFEGGSPLVNNARDPARAKRYTQLWDALYRNPDLRLPNLDKILPLPPAPLPKWNGDKKLLIDAAKPVVQSSSAPASSPATSTQPASSASPASAQRTSQSDAPRSETPPLDSPPLDSRIAQGVARAAQLPRPELRRYGHETVPATGIWQAALPHDHPRAKVFNDWRHQVYLMKGAPFPLSEALAGDIDPEDVHWRWWGQPNQSSDHGITHISVESIPLELG